MPGTKLVSAAESKRSRGLRLHVQSVSCWGYNVHEAAADPYIGQGCVYSTWNAGIRQCKHSQRSGIDLAAPELGYCRRPAAHTWTRVGAVQLQSCSTGCRRSAELLLSIGKTSIAPCELVSWRPGHRHSTPWRLRLAVSPPGSLWPPLLHGRSCQCEHTAFNVANRSPSLVEQLHGQHICKLHSTLPATHMCSTSHS